MAGFDNVIGRANVPIPETISTEIIQEAAGSSVLLTNARKARMSTKTMKQPVLSALPDAFLEARLRGLDAAERAWLAERLEGLRGPRRRVQSSRMY